LPEMFKSRRGAPHPMPFETMASTRSVARRLRELGRRKPQRRENKAPPTTKRRS
jgi:hypothetical protein